MSLSSVIAEALKLRAQMKADGMPPDQIEAAFEQVVRSIWPKTREWHYQCDACRDTGWEVFQCGPETHCGRPKRVGPKTIGGLENWTGLGQCQPGHDFVRPCRFCAKGPARQRAIDGKTTLEQDFTKAVQQRPMKKFGEL